MKIGLVNVDSHNFPNLCLMKLSSLERRSGGKQRMGEILCKAGRRDDRKKNNV